MSGLTFHAIPCEGGDTMFDIKVSLRWAGILDETFTLYESATRGGCYGDVGGPTASPPQQVTPRALSGHRVIAYYPNW